MPGAQGTRDFVAISPRSATRAFRLSRTSPGLRGGEKKLAHAAKGLDGGTRPPVTMWMDHSRSLLV